eukprot:61607_1
MCRHLITQTWAASTTCALGIVFIIRFIYESSGRWWIYLTKRNYQSIQSNAPSVFWDEHMNKIPNLKWICLSYVDITVNASNILNPKNETLKSNLYDSLLSTNTHNNFGILCLRLLFSAKRETFDTDMFYSSVLGTKDVIVLLKTEFNSIVGGFTSIGIQEGSLWTYLKGHAGLMPLTLRESRWCYDSKAFLFQIHPQTKVHRFKAPSDGEIFTKEFTHKHGMSGHFLMVFGFGMHDFNLLKRGESRRGEAKQIPGRCYAESNVFDFDIIEFAGGYDPDQFDTNLRRISFHFETIEVFKISWS